VLLAAEGKTDLEIADTLKISNQKAARWRKWFLQLNLVGLVKDAPRPGRKPTISAKVKEELIRRTTQSKPTNRLFQELQASILGLPEHDQRSRRR
jgi:hypothetical protein